MAVSAADGPIVNTCRLGAGTDVINSSSFTHFDGILFSLGQMLAASFFLFLSFSFLFRAVRLSIQLHIE